MKIGDEVCTGIPLPGIPAGTTGEVKEVGRLFVAVQFEDGRLAYYSPRQLEPAVARDVDADPAPTPDAPLGIRSASVPYGSHLCMLPSTHRRAIDILARYLAAGLEVDDYCTCLVPDHWTLPLRTAIEKLGANTARALEAGSLVMGDPDELYLQGSEFTGAKQLRRSGTLVESLSARSEVRPRAFAYVGDAMRRVDPAEWWKYEREVTPLIEKSGLLACCGYAPARASSKTWQTAIAVHPYVLKAGSLTVGGAL